MFAQKNGLPPAVLAAPQGLPRRFQPGSLSVPGLAMDPGTAPIDTVLNTFTKYCPRIRLLSLRVDGTLAVADFANWAPLRAPRSGLHLVLPPVVPRGDTTRSTLFARYLKRSP